MKIELLGEWKPLLRPSKYCRYVNDHTLFQDRQGNWRLLGTCGYEYSMLKESFFVEAKGSSLKDMKETRKLFPGIIKIAPFVFREKSYHLFHGPGLIRHYTSEDGNSWKHAGIAMAGSPFLRDPCIIRYNKQYIIYMTEFGNKIVAYTSTDLFSWKLYGQVFSLGSGMLRSFNSSCESPFVFLHKGKFWLLTTIVPSPSGRKENYLKTAVFCSDDPLIFGHHCTSKRNSAKLVGYIEAHAPEVVQIRGRVLITTCGWAGFPKPEGVGEGVWIRELSIGVGQRVAPPRPRAELAKESLDLAYVISTHQ